jgi:SAM-dependent methyltransferase
MFGVKTAVLRWLRSAPGAPATVAPHLKPKAWLEPEEEALIPPRDLWIGPEDPINHYYRWSHEYLAYLTILTDLHREQAVLELGCGHGRTARCLMDYLREPGRYVGLDVDRRRLEDAKVRLGRPNFEFVWADVRNAHYNPAGAVAAEDYAFPFESRAFDVIYAASLFTHLLPGETRRYLREARRVLKPGGRCLFSFFLSDYYRGPGTSVSWVYGFDSPLPGHAGVRVRDPEHPDAVIAYPIASVTACAQDAGLRVERVLPGYWSNSPGLAVNEQDLVLLSLPTP